MQWADGCIQLSLQQLLLLLLLLLLLAVAWPRAVVDSRQQLLTRGVA
jgi:hypothetical protein